MKTNENQKDSITQQFYGEIPNVDVIPDEDNFWSGIDNFASMSIEAVYVVDFQKRCFHFVADHDLFLCGHSQEEAMQLGYDFYSKIVYQKDMPLLIEIHSAVLGRLYDKEEQLDDVNYFSFTFRIRNYPQIGKNPEYLMVYHKLKPIFINGQLRFGICLLTSSVMQKSGNLNTYFKSSPDFDKYSFKSKKWNRQQIESLTEREILILRLSKQGMSNKKIANKLNISYGRLKNIITELYENIHVKSMSQAVIFATNHLMVFDPRLKTPDISKKSDCKKQKRHILTPEELTDIIVCLDKGESISSIANRKRISRGAIYNALKSGKLNRNKNQ
jgi:DNA-binding NarL/FixJ family response regulator